MNPISLLSQETIDKIAAGEVIERPASIVKELVENSVDAGANAITVEIRDGGISLIRITDNGSGIPEKEVPIAFLRHATSKIRKVEDLITSGTLGFRGEALSSIAAVCQVELITKTAGSITGVRYVIEGGAEKLLEEIGAPEGTTFLVKNLFYHTPARKKFLKTPATEAGYISDLMERMAVSHPDISFKFINNHDVKLHTSGNNNLKDIIYGIYGRDITANVVKTESRTEQMYITGFIGKPVISRGNRNYENYFVNGRYVKSAIIARAIEDAYKPFMMNHRYPFTALMIQVDPEKVDVNVHPNKMEVRFSDQQAIYDQVLQTVKDALAGKELIPEFTVEPVKKTKEFKKTISEGKNEVQERKEKTFTSPEPFEKIRSQLIAEANSPYEMKYPKRSGKIRPVTGNISVQKDPVSEDFVNQSQLPAVSTAEKKPDKEVSAISEKEKTVLGTLQNEIAYQKVKKEIPVQMELFERKLLSEENNKQHKLIGQLFDTYWLVEFDEKLYIIDQHAAHEKVMYERFMSNLSKKEHTSQLITPPMIVTVSMQEELLIKKHMEAFQTVGFELSHFGGKEYAITAVPANLYGITDKALFIEILDGLNDVNEKASFELVKEKIASMSCKAAVKGNHRMSVQEADALIRELLTLENPYNCPHGRPTIISMSKYELEKKFKRVLS